VCSGVRRESRGRHRGQCGQYGWLGGSHGIKSLTLPILGDSNFESWRLSLILVASAMSAKMHLEKDIDPTKLEDDVKKNFYTLASIMPNSLSEHP
jgi:hypothetical protein